METLETPTQFKKGRSGWEGQTITTYKGITWKISTYKRNRGILATSAQECKISNSGGFSMIEFELFTSHHIVLIQQEVTCTEKAVKMQHYAALQKLERMKQDGTLPTKEPAAILETI